MAKSWRPWPSATWPPGPGLQVFSAPKSQKNLWGVWILFRSVENAEIEDSSEWIPTITHQTELTWGTAAVAAAYGPQARPGKPGSQSPVEWALIISWLPSLNLNALRFEMKWSGRHALTEQREFELRHLEGSKIWYHYDSKYSLEFCDIIPTMLSQNCDILGQKSAYDIIHLWHHSGYDITYIQPSYSSCKLRHIWDHRWWEPQDIIGWILWMHDIMVLWWYDIMVMTAW